MPSVNKTHFSYDERGLGGAHMIQEQFLTMYRKIEGATKMVDDGPPHSSNFRRPHYNQFGEYWEKITPRYRNASVKPKVDSRPPESMPFLESLYIVSSPRQRRPGSISTRARPQSSGGAANICNNGSRQQVRPPWDGDPSTKARTFATSAKQMMMESIAATQAFTASQQRLPPKGTRGAPGNSVSEKKVYTPIEKFEFACERRKEELANEYDRIQQRKRARLAHLERQIDQYAASLQQQHESPHDGVGDNMQSPPEVLVVQRVTASDSKFPKRDDTRPAELALEETQNGLDSSLPKHIPHLPHSDIPGESSDKTVTSRPQRPLSSSFKRPLSVLSQQSKYHPATSRPNSARIRSGGADTPFDDQQPRPTFLVDEGITKNTVVQKSAAASPMTNASPPSPDEFPEIPRVIEGSALVLRRRSSATSSAVGGGFASSSSLKDGSQQRNREADLGSSGGDSCGAQSPTHRSRLATSNPAANVASNYIRRIRSRGSLRSLSRGIQSDDE